MALKSWLRVPSGSPFSIANLPFGVISTKEQPTGRVAIAIGDFALDLFAFTAAGGFSKSKELQPYSSVFAQPALNGLAAFNIQYQTRQYIQSVLAEDTPHPELLKDNEELQKLVFTHLSQVQCHLPFHIGDYTDFYAGLNHAFNVGVLFRGASNALQPNYTHLPVGYHGRASTVVVSGTPIRRPRGQILTDPTAEPKLPIFSPCKKLDIELELACFVSKPNEMGSPIDIKDAEEHVFGYVLMNDWSARDIQAWEYVPLGPFNSKNFGTTISPWVVLPEALEPFRTSGLQRSDSGQLLPYLTEPRKDNAYDIKLEVELRPSGTDKGKVISRSNSKYLLYSFPQMLTHHTVTGCAMNTGDLLGSGTISGTEADSVGSLLEMTKNGKEPFTIDGVQRAFLEDGDEVILRGTAGQGEDCVGFGDCAGVILPALEN
ncbi:fumarylacetoacetate hydrolase FahA [Rhizodiscina lignyota]|uniref:Fumarylacetoacetase n=1 Tax=Rhizodiscina lignyota TaxID=1504668 RepID=A0A9P4M307_9PEZI|nr:fumarylacetoacetate hydrolase FahA [Rhizodiscina lignyota]